MKRLRVILLFLLLGAIVNVAVAWGLAISVNFSAFSPTYRFSRLSGAGLTSDTSPCWGLYREGHFGSTLLYGTTVLEDDYWDYQIDYSMFDMSHVPAWSQFAAPPSMRLWVSEISRGWPFRTLFWINTKSNTTSTKQYVWIVRENPSAIYLPLFPIWRGLFFNTFFNATLLWLLIPGPFVLRRYFRRKRGLCVKCAYDLRGAEHEACPECGTGVRMVKPA